MIDERLARGYARQMLRDIKPPAQATIKSIEKLYDNYSHNRRGQERGLMRLSKKHRAIISSIIPQWYGSRSTANIIYWTCMSGSVENTNYMDKDSLVPLVATFESTRNGKTFNNTMGPVGLCNHAICRWIERDLTLPEYDLGQWLGHLKPIIVPAFLLNHLAYDNQDLTYIYRSVALPTLGGLFVGFIIPAGDESRDSYLQVAVRSFYGQHELDEDLQQLHARLLNDCEETVAAHEDYGWDRLWQGQESALLEALKGAA